MPGLNNPLEDLQPIVPQDEYDRANIDLKPIIVGFGGCSEEGSGESLPAYPDNGDRHALIEQDGALSWVSIV